MARTWYCARCMHSFDRDVGRCPNLACGAHRPEAGWGDILGEGDLLDRHYRIERVLAIGGAGITYLAREVDGGGVEIEPDLAIKVLFAQRDSGAFLRRLANEAQILQELAHPNIVQSMGFVQRRGHAPYLVTLFERGGSLHDHVQRTGPMPPSAALEVLDQVLAALDVAHARGVVHRDLKPQNVLLRDVVPFGEVPEVRVADFGIAKVTGTFGEGVTQMGVFVGTPEYAAPEQFLGRTPTPAADVFAAGGLLTFLLTGRHPVDFSDRRDALACHREVVAQVPPRLEGFAGGPELEAVRAVLAGTMLPLPEDRWSVAEVREAVARKPRGGSARPAPRPVVETGGAETIVVPDLDVGLPRVEGGGTLVAAETDLGARTVVSPEPEPPPPPRASSLDDLFDFGIPSEPAAGEPSEPAAAEPSASAAVSAPAPVDPSAPSDVSAPAAADPFEPRGPAAARRPAAPPALPLREDGTLWDGEVPPPDPLPDAIDARLTALGRAPAASRPALVEALRGEDPRPLVQAVRDARRGEVALRRGVCLAVALLELRDGVPAIRGLLGDRDAPTRALAAHALGRVGGGGALAGLSRLLSDPDPLVRASAALALAASGDRAEVVGRWLDRLDRDADPLVAAALDEARRRLRS